MNPNEIINEFQQQFREREEQYNHIEQEEEEDEIEQPLFETFVQQRGSDSIKVLTRFSINEFNQILSICENSMIKTGRGRRSKLTPKDKLFVTLTYIASGSTLKKMNNLFGISVSTVFRVIDSTINSIYQPLTNHFFNNHITLDDDELHFQYFPNAVGAIDTTIIHISKPEDREEQRQNWSFKHACCSVKIQVLVRPNGICTCFYGFKRGAEHDLIVFRSSKWLDQKLFYQTPLPNGTFIRGHYPALFDKGYTGLNAQGYHEAIITLRKPIGRELTQQEINYNNKVESDRAIVENFFGRVKTLFGIIANRYRGDRNLNLEKIIGVCLSLTNFYNSLHPMRSNQVN